MIKKWKQFNELYVQSHDFKCVNDEVDLSVLTKLDDERNSLMEGDEVLATYFSGGYDTYQFKLERWFDQNDNCYVLGTSTNDTVYTIEHAFHIVKKETYNDFAEPEKVLEKASNDAPDWLLYISTEIEEEVRKTYENAIDKVFGDLHHKYKTVSGDADFTTCDLIEDYKDEYTSKNIIETTTNQVITNMDMSSIAKSLKSDKVNFQILNEIKDERNSLEDEDKVVLVTSESLKILKLDRADVQPLRSSLIKVVIGTYNSFGDGSDGVFIHDDIDRFSLSFSIDDCIHVVKKETYEDFVGSKLH